MTLSPWLTRAELAAELKLSLTKIDELLRSHKIVSLRVGRAVRIPRAAIESYVQRMMRQQNEDAACGK